MDGWQVGYGSGLVRQGWSYSISRLGLRTARCRLISQYPELVAASYNKNPSSLNDPDGIVAIWNLHLLERPEFVFHAPVGSIHCELWYIGRRPADDARSRMCFP